LGAPSEIQREGEGEDGEDGEDGGDDTLNEVSSCCKRLVWDVR
jgi:hypothetical protein